MSNEQKNQEQRQSERQSEARLQSVILVELGNDEQNLNPRLEPLGECYRGIMHSANNDVSVKLTPENYRMPSQLPGYHIEVDMRRRRVTVYDPLSRTEFNRQRESLNDYLERTPDGVSRRKFTPKKDTVIDNCLNKQIVDWLENLKNLVDANHAQLRNGEFPKEISEYHEAERTKAMELQYGKATAVPQLV